TAEAIKQEIRAQLGRVGVRKPGLATILVGEHPASAAYVRNKLAACEAVGINGLPVYLDKNIGRSELLHRIETLNAQDDVDGILVQLPLPQHIDEREVIRAISPDKDVDGFHPYNLGALATSSEGFVPATPAGVAELLKRNGIATAGCEVVIVGRSNIVGTPMALLLSRPGMDATVTLCHSHTRDLHRHTLRAEILIVAAGKQGLIRADMVREGAVVVDVGIHRLPAPERPSGYRLVGDVDFDAVAPKTSAITPVPGGVGPMTVAMLLHNTLTAFMRRVRA
ncbi:MAG: bifunctional methylenetetrahydrofolate dehydrogenase/methenyltetrahydrofolate cyclohydrolase FolD, partial [Bacteroidia bacterium]|nr:bifunctional methylenetetrahydrofolate dehydrogenase/methenyltetrahydrofolate cyclohydrolase FolD [Bacteroidia bacterium]